jgi:hypothetical protein
MASPAQINANQSNAQHSTGPRTAEGKARVAQNAVRHGLTSRRLVIRDDEREEFDALQESLVAELDPQGAVETVTFREILHAAWNLARFSRIEAEVSTGTAEDFTNDATTTVLDRLGRYQARAQRSWYKGLAELRKLQTNRALRAQNVAEEEAAKIPVMADIRELTKQSQPDTGTQAVSMALQMLDDETEMLLHEARQKYATRAPYPLA